MSPESPTSMQALSAADFARRFSLLVVIAYVVPAAIGLGFIVYIQVFTPAHVLALVTTPLEPVFVAASLAFGLWYLKRTVRPIHDWLAEPAQANVEQVRRALARFPLAFWGTFLGYLVIAPAWTIMAAEVHAGFSAQPIDWFRISLVALIVSIIVGLPIFFMMLDLLGRAVGNLPLTRPQVSIRTKVFLIGALVPLLIDTMLVQYYWTRTGYFTAETFGMWLMLELLAVAGSLLFMRSFGQALEPLRGFIGATAATDLNTLDALVPRSTDELGVLTQDVRRLLTELHAQTEILLLSNRVLRTGGSSADLEGTLGTLTEVCRQATAGDMCFVLLYDEDTRELRGVVHTGAPYRADGHYRLPLDGSGLSVLAFKQNRTIAIRDVRGHPFCNSGIVDRFGVLSAIATPLRREGEMIGVLISANQQVLRDYGARETAIMEMLAREAAAAVQAQVLHQRLDYLAYHDALTGLSNRALLLDRLDHATAQAHRRNCLVGVLFLDLDRFKTVNDSLGHEAGDRMLRAVADRLVECVREGDTVARLGGDEFVIVVEDMRHVNDLVSIASNVLESFRRPFSILGRSVYMGTSIGMTVYPLDDSNPEHLIKHADTAMYGAKERGGSAYEFHTAEMTARAQEHLELEAALRRGLERGEIMVHYQPIFDLRSGRIRSVEALVRWQHPARGLLVPGEFLPAAEESGLIVALGQRVFRAVCAQQREWVSLGFGPLPVSVNLSAREIIHPAFLDMVREVLRTDDCHCVGHARIEVTEVGLLRDHKAVLATMRELASLGIAATLDDFGSSYSSLTSLREFPIATLKIDRALVRGVANNNADRELVRALVAMARALGLELVAKGVEHKEQVEFLREAGCDAAQGNFFAAPVPASALTEWLRENTGGLDQPAAPSTTGTPRP